jgi:uncharacterized protein YuzB (UPF0349 family)
MRCDEQAMFNGE